MYWGFLKSLPFAIQFKGYQVYLSPPPPPAGMLDKNTLIRCASVSQHWAVLAKKVKKDYSIHAFIHNQIALLQVLLSGGAVCRLASLPCGGWLTGAFQPTQQTLCMASRSILLLHRLQQSLSFCVDSPLIYTIVSVLSRDNM